MVCRWGVTKHNINENEVRNRNGDDEEVRREL